MIFKKWSAIKSLRLFTGVLDVKKKTYVRRVGAAKSKYKAIRAGSIFWSSIPKRKGYTKINEQVKKYLYNWIIQHPQVVKSPIANNFLKESIDGHSEPQLVSNFYYNYLSRNFIKEQRSPHKRVELRRQDMQKKNYN